jgi:glutathione S-transferase
VLEELGVSYDCETVDLMESEQDGDAYHAIQPLGLVPALKTDSYTMFASVAIVLSSIDEHPNKNLAPPHSSPERAIYY